MRAFTERVSLIHVTRRCRLPRLAVLRDTRDHSRQKCRAPSCVLESYTQISQKWKWSPQLPCPAQGRWAVAPFSPSHCVSRVSRDLLC